MKEKIRRCFFNMVYQLYKHQILFGKLSVYSMEETIEALCDSEKSLVRYGDGEIRMIEGQGMDFQAYDETLAKRLREILQFQDEKILIAIPDIFGSLDVYTDRSKEFWQEHLFSYRRKYEKYCNTNKKYYNAFISRSYYPYKDKERCRVWFQSMKKIWEGKELLIVEGEISHNGVGNDLFDNAGEIERIICPSKEAYSFYDRILEACLSFPKDKLVLIGLGHTAKVLAQDLVRAGYRVIDIGNLDKEYEWCLKGIEEKELIPKHAIVGIEANQMAGYHEYLEQVKIWIK